MLIDIKSKEPLYYQFVIGINKCGGICNTHFL